MAIFASNKTVFISIKMILVLVLLKLNLMCKNWIVLEKRCVKTYQTKGKFHISTQILRGNTLFSVKIYTAGKFFTRPPVATNFKSVGFLRKFHAKSDHIKLSLSLPPTPFLSLPPTRWGQGVDLLAFYHQYFEMFRFHHTINFKIFRSPRQYFWYADQVILTRGPK